jgi:hypothetical protein
LSLSKGRRLARDNTTRWHSWQKAIKLATTRPYHEVILAYADDECKLDELSEDNCDLSLEANKLLVCLKQTTKALESSAVTLDKVLLAMALILKRFEGGEGSTRRHSLASITFNSG